MSQRLFAAIAILLFCSAFDEGGCEACDKPDPPPCGMNCPSGTQCDLQTHACVNIPSNTPPDTVLTRSPPAIMRTADADFRFTATITGSSFDCKVDATPFVPCSSPEIVTVGEGQHTFTVRAKSAAGTVDPTPAMYTWVVDATPPETVITSGPQPGATGDVSFEFTSETGATFKCKLDAGATADCLSGVAYNGLALGDHTFVVFATDRAGNVDPTPAEYPFTVSSAP